MNDFSNKRAVIICAAHCDSFDYIRQYLKADDIIICADGGRKNALSAGLTADYYIGDGDSGGSPAGLEAVVLPCEKDFTDSEAAVVMALNMGFKNLILCACTGGREDHNMANLFLLERIYEENATGMIIDENNEIRYVKSGKYRIYNEPKYHYLSLLPIDKELHGVSISGVKYAVSDCNFKRSYTLGVSNEILSDYADISIKEGSAFLIRSNPEY